MHWYGNKNGTPKTHRRPRTCKHCVDHPKGGCLLPFRKTRKTRWLKKLEGKPLIFGSLMFQRLFSKPKEQGEP